MHELDLEKTYYYQDTNFPAPETEIWPKMEPRIAIFHRKNFKIELAIFWLKNGPQFCFCSVILISDVILRYVGLSLKDQNGVVSLKLLIFGSSQIIGTW